MALEIAQIAAGWPLAVSLAAATASGLRAGRRRTALNEALHELRRPLQALALSGPGTRSAGPGLDWSLQMAGVALERLDREINGQPAAVVRTSFRARLVLDAVVDRWEAQAAGAGGSLELRWRAGDVVLHGDRCEIAQALDNLVVNAIEHGGPWIVVEGAVVAGRLRIIVRDSGRGPRPKSQRELPMKISHLSGRRRRGHGLRIVRKIAAANGGNFRLCRSEDEAVAVLDLPLLDSGANL